MAENLRTANIGEIVASSSPDDVLVAYGLGSCVAVCLFDPVARVGGMLHALLPAALNGNGANGTPTKFVDRGVPLLIDSVVKLGAEQRRLIARLCGGAHVLTAPGFDDALNIGSRNVLAAEQALQAAKVRIQAQATGGHVGRTVKLYVASGQVIVKSLGQEEEAI
jgi:chemotaxis protein CheD